MRRKLTFRKRAAAALLAVCIFAIAPCSAMADTIAEIKAEQEELDRQKTELESKLAELKDDTAQKQEYQETLDQQISVLQNQIDSARNNINTLNASITELTASIEKSQKDIEETMNTFKARLRALYTEGNITTLQVLLDSSSMAEFSMVNQAIQSISDRDRQMMEKIETFMKDTEAERKQLEEEKAEVAELQKTLESKQEELGGIYEENAALIASLENQQASTQEAIAENEAQGQAAISKMEELIAIQKAAEEEARKQQEAANNNGASGGGGIVGDGDTNYPTGGGGVAGFNPVWPLPGVTYISCYYGDGGHRGLDIAGPYGTPIVAAESGTVLEANNYDSWGDSWGYYVLIYHNGTYTTRYAHMSSMIVSSGQTVSQGEIIGYEGSTGNSSGPHLHFEVYENGTRVNPMAFL